MQSNASQENLPLDYILLVFVLSIPFWLFGGGNLPLPINLPVSALMFINPLIAASILSYEQSGLTGIKELFKKAFDYRKIENKIWYIPILLLVPFILFLSYAIMRLTGLPVPDRIVIPLLLVPVFILMFFPAALCEELGWMGYAIDPLQNRWGALMAGIILGLVWAIWHIVGWSRVDSLIWTAWQGFGSVALRILTVWIYNNTGKSVFSAILFHDMVNVSEFLFPNYGSHYNPFLFAMIVWLTAVIIAFGWGAKTLGEFRYAGVSRL